MAHVEFKMIITRRLAIDDFEIAMEVMNLLTDHAKDDKIDAIGHFLQGAKDADSIGNDDYDSVRFMVVMNNEEVD